MASKEISHLAALASTVELHGAFLLVEASTVDRCAEVADFKGHEGVWGRWHSWPTGLEQRLQTWLATAASAKEIA